MSLQDQILNLIRRKPGIRTMQICDTLDIEIDACEAALAPMLGRDITKEVAMGPSNRKVTIFFPLAGGAPAAPMAKPAAIEEKPMTNIEKTIAFIQAQPAGLATSAEIHALLGLKPTDYPSTYLKTALNDGRLVKDGKFWRLGAGDGRARTHHRTAAGPGFAG